MALRLLRLVHAGEAEGQRAQAAAADGTRGRRAQDVDRGVRRAEILPRDRLDHAVSPRGGFRGDEAAARIRRRDRRGDPAARHRGRARAGAEPQPGVPARPDVAGRRLALQPADGDARLCGALFGARRRGDQGRRALAAPARRQVARRHRRGAGRCRECRGGARAMVDRRGRAARHQGAARDQARLSPPLRSEGQCVAVAADHRHRIRLCDHPDGAGHPAHHRRRIREPRRAADAGAVRPA